MRTPLPHQTDAIGFILKKRHLKLGAALFMPPGTCKTSCVIQSMAGATYHNNVIVICRKDDLLTWEIELALEGVPEEAVTTIRSSADVAVIGERYRSWTLVTYDLIKRDAVVHYLVSIPYVAMVVLDESQLIKQMETTRTKRVLAFLDWIRLKNEHFVQVVAMSGTPITNEVSDIFAQALAVDQGETFGTSFWKFRTKYYLKSGYGWFRKRTAKADIKAAMTRFSFTVPKDTIKLPPVKRTIVRCPMSQVQRELTQQILNDWQVDDVELTYVTERVEKLRQIASGFYYDKDNVPVRLTTKECPKLGVLFKRIRGHIFDDCEKVVVWCAHIAEIEYIHHYYSHELQIDTVKFHGGLSTAERQAARSSFLNDPAVNVFIASVDMGVGMNELIASPTAIYYSNSYKAASRIQSEARTRRKGSERHEQLRVIDLVTAGSVDEDILRSVHSNVSVAASIVRRLTAAPDHMRNKVLERMFISDEHSNEG